MKFNNDLSGKSWNKGFLSVVIFTFFFICSIISGCKISQNSNSGSNSKYVTAQREVILDTVIGDTVVYTMEITINKGYLNSFARYRDIYSNSVLFFKHNYSKDGIHTDKNYIKILWLKLPPYSRFLISYKVYLLKSMGPCSVKGEFSYLINDNRRTIIIPETKLLYIPDSIDKINGPTIID